MAILLTEREGIREEKQVSGKASVCILKLKSLWEYHMVLSRRDSWICGSAEFWRQCGPQGHPRVMLPRGSASWKKRNS